MSLKYGRAGRIHLFQAMIRFGVRQRMAAHLRQVDYGLQLGCVSDKACSSCRKASTREFWRSKMKQLFMIARAENIVLAFVYPLKKELVYFSRFQRITCFA